MGENVELSGFGKLKSWAGVICSFFLIVSLAACNLPTAAEQAQSLSLSPESVVSATSLVITPEPQNTATELPTPTAADTATELPTATATYHPMFIPAMQETPYPGSEIVIEQELASASNYYRYYAYYLSEGLKIYGLLTVPFGDPPEGGWPAIVFNHGYIPPEVYRTTERYEAYVDRIARSQYVVYRIDYRGHDRSEGEARGAYGRPDYTIDVLNAVSSLQQYPSVNPEKIGMWGHSMGGYLTLRSMVLTDDIKVGVIWAGVVVSYPDMITLWRRDRPGPTPTPPSFAYRWRNAWIEEYGSPEENPEFWRMISANSYLEQLSGPIQLHHGTADDSVPLIFSEILVQQIQEAGGEVELYTYEGDNHNLSNFFTLAMQRSIEFFDLVLKAE